MSTGDRWCWKCGGWLCFCGQTLRKEPFYYFTTPDTQSDDIDTIWQLRLTLTEIAWAARCQYERVKKFNEGYDVGFSQARLGSLIGTGGDTK